MDEPEYDIAAAAAAHIVNVLSNPDGCKAILFGKVIFIVLEGIKEAGRRRHELVTTRSEN
jgi:hypothetical protein